MYDLNTGEYEEQWLLEPSPAMKQLDRLVGCWKVSGEAQGQVTYEWLEGDVLTIWGGEKGSPAYYRGEFDASGNTLHGGWVWPGGGYQTTLVRIE